MIFLYLHINFANYKYKQSTPMKSTIQKSFPAILVFILLIFTTLGYSQSLNEAGEAFNSGIKAAGANDMELAIQSYTHCVGVCDQLGEEGAELKSKAEKQLGQIHLKLGLDQYKNKQFNEALKNLKASSKYAEIAGDAKTRATASSYVARVYYSSGMSKLKKKDYENAMTLFDKALSYDGKYYKAYYGKGLTYKLLNDPDNMKASFSKVFELAGNDTKTINKAKSSAYKYFLAAGTKKLQAGSFADAAILLEESTTYQSPDGNTCYYLALAYNGISSWDKAIDAAQKGLALEGSDQANLYFEMARAYEGKGDPGMACDTYKKVTSGPNAAAAKHKVSVGLKCN